MVMKWSQTVGALLEWHGVRRLELPLECREFKRLGLDRKMANEGTLHG
jgi:hypothetical protein